MKTALLSVKNLMVKVNGKKILEGVDLRVRKGEIHVIMGPNGSGKSSLANTLLGDKQYKVIKGQIKFQNEDLLKMTVDERARAGLLVVYQNPVVIPGVKVFSLGKMANQALRQARGKLGIESVVELKEKLEKLAIRVGLTKQHVMRNVNEGFSGGEKKRLELLQLLLLEPKVAILDEVDSGMDEEGRAKVVEIVREMSKKGTAFIIITHYRRFLENLKLERVMVMEKGKLN